MLTLCPTDANSTNNVTKWNWSNFEYTQSECIVDLLNAAISSCFAYVILLILIYLRCSRLHSQLLSNDYLFTTHNVHGFLIASLFIAHITELGDAVLSDTGRHDSLVPASALILWFGETMLHKRMERARRPKYLIFSTILWSLTLMGRILRLLVVINVIDANLSTCLRLYTTVITTVLILLIIVVNLYTLHIEIFDNIYVVREPIAQLFGYKHSYASLFSKATFWWLTPLLWAGYHQPLEITDLGLLPAEQSTQTQFSNFQNIYQKQTTTSLWKCYVLLCWKNFLLGGILKFLGDCMQLVGPLGISVIITYIDQNHVYSKIGRYVSIAEFFTNGYVMGILVFLAAILQGTLSQSSTHLVNMEGIHLKSALQSAIYNKSLKLYSWKMMDSNGNNVKTRKESNGSKSETSTDVGLVINLLAEDSFNVMSFIWIAHYIWAIPLKIGVLIFLLHMKLGISAVFGSLFCILIMSPLQFWIGKNMSKNSEFISDKSDERLRKVNEMLQGIKLIKLLAWENLQETRLQETRKKELRYLNRDSLYWALMTFLTHVSSILITLATFGIHSFLEEQTLNAEDVFAGLALFNQLTVPLFIFPVTVPIIINAIVSTNRIAKFLAKAEINSKILPPNSNSPKDERKGRFGLRNIEEEPDSDSKVINKEDVVTVTNTSFAWNEHEKVTLTLGSLCIPKEKITMIIGKVGSGKSSLISALLGEMHQRTGEITWSNGTTIAYVAQKPWLINGSVRENILFGEAYQSERYQQVIQVCCLQPDLDLLPGGDQTEVGEKGINLSGGQKQRIAIARAIYSPSNTVIMDDPLSALDYQVSKELFENGIQELLVRQQHRTVILITNRTQFVTRADKIIIVDKGGIRDEGSLQQIETNYPNITKEWYLGLSTSDHRSKTAKERWNLFRLMSRIGNHLRHRNSIHGTWTTNEETHVTPLQYRPLRKRPSSMYGSRQLNFALLPLPTDDCDEKISYEDDLAPRGGCPRDPRLSWMLGANMKLHRNVSRAISLQTNFGSRPTVIRQLSTPSVSQRTLYTSFHLPNHSNRYQEIANPSMYLEEERILLGTLTNEGDNPNIERPVMDRATSNEVYRNDDELRIPDGMEERSYGRIPKRVFWVYINACGICASASYLCSALAWQVSRVCTDYWLSKWTDDHNRSTLTHTSYYLKIYAILSIVSMLFSIASNGLGQLCGAFGRKHLHERMLKNVLKCPLHFFETTPIGRIINRFSSDLAVIDKKIAISIQRLLQFLFLCLSAILINAIITPWFLIIAIPVCLVYYMVQKFYRCSSRELQRLDSLTRTPILTHFSETLNGLVSIRAYGHQSRFITAMFLKMDVNTNAFLILNTSNRWLGIYLDYLGGLIVLTAIIACLLSSKFYPEFVTPAMVGLAVNYTLLIPVYLTWVVKFLADMEMYMAAVERVEKYSKMATENYRKRSIKLPKNWPQKGEITFDNVTLKYKGQTEPVISQLNLTIPAGQKIGICGRTGSGKSSLILSLLGVVDVTSGMIKIDGIDLATVPLQLLRTKISMIPQDVLLFSGTVRDNLDPVGRYSDADLWRSLDIAQVKQLVAEHLGDLDGEIREGGCNLSSGERQLLCLARVILQQSAITVMDEATSLVDPITEKSFMAAAATAFQRATVITVAHRLEMIMDYDRIIVLENGKVIEDGPPAALKQKLNGIFTKMLQAADTINSPLENEK